MLQRRRTQIRLAQRAYRHRKDTAITSLEQRVKELEKANDDMSQEFHQLYDLLLSEHVLDTSPQIVQPLTTIANRFISVSDKAKSGSTDGGKSDGSDEPYAVDSAAGMANSIVNASSHSSSIPKSNAQAPQPAQPLATVPHTSSSLNLPLPTFSEGEVHNLNLAVATSAPVSAATTTAATTAPPMVHLPASMSYEVVTQPTPENASFPFYSSMKPDSDNFPSQISPGPSPYGTLSAPVSYASHELTFGRRLQRVTTERGLQLISMPNPPPERFAAVFGFCLLFEPREAIINRLQLTLSRNHYEDLSHWRAPFTNLGGAGTFYPDARSAQNGSDDALATMPFGNEGTRSYCKPQELTGFSMGPFNPDVIRTLDERMDHKMKMQWPGFEGEFFDTDEVEVYLRQLGVFIPQPAEFVEADIDLKEIEQEDGLSQSAGSTDAPVAGNQHSGMGSADSAYGSTQNGTWTTGSNSPLAAGADPLTGMAAERRQRPPMAAAPHGQTGSPTDSAPNGVMTYVLPPGAQGVWSQSMNWPTRAKISFSVEQLVQGKNSRSALLCQLALWLRLLTLDRTGLEFCMLGPISWLQEKGYSRRSQVRGRVGSHHAAPTLLTYRWQEPGMSRYRVATRCYPTSGTLQLCLNCLVQYLFGDVTCG